MVMGLWWQVVGQDLWWHVPTRIVLDVFVRMSVLELMMMMEDAPLKQRSQPTICNILQRRKTVTALAGVGQEAKIPPSLQHTEAMCRMLSTQELSRTPASSVDVPRCEHHHAQQAPDTGVCVTAQRWQQQQCW